MKLQTLIMFFLLTTAEFVRSSDGNDSQCEEGQEILAKILISPFFNIRGEEDVPEAQPCEIQKAKTVKDLYEALYSADADISYEQFLLLYQLSQNYLPQYGGYTNIQRMFDTSVDFANWMNKFQKGTVDKISDIMDLQTLTEFLQVLTVKYGYDWLLALGDTYASIATYTRIENIVQLSKALYESSSAEELQQKMDITEIQAEMIWQIFVTTNYEQFDKAWQERFSHVPKDYLYLGEKGLFNLVY